MTTIDTTALRSASKSFSNYSTQLHSEVRPNLAVCAVDGRAFPVAAGSLRSLYRQAFDELSLSTRSAETTLHTLSAALDRVAVHYQTQDQKNAEMFQKPPVAPPQPTQNTPYPGDDGSWLKNTGDTAVLFSDNMVVISTLILTLSAAVVDAGAAVAVATTGIITLMFLADPLPWNDAHDGWAAIETVLIRAAADVPQLAARVTARSEWSGDAANAFTSYVSLYLGPNLTAAAPLAGAMKQLAGNAFRGLLVTALAHVAATVTTLTTCIALSANPEPGSRGTSKLAVVGAWAGVVIALITDLAGQFDVWGGGADTVRTAAQALKATMDDDKGNIDAKSIALTPADTQRIQDWKSWTPKPA